MADTAKVAEQVAALDRASELRAFVCEQHPALATAVARLEARDLAAQLRGAGLGACRVLDLVGRRVGRAPRSVRRWLSPNAQ